MGTLKERLGRAVANKGLSIGDAWNLLSEALEYIERMEAAAERMDGIARALREEGEKNG